MGLHAALRHAGSSISSSWEWRTATRHLVRKYPQAGRVREGTLHGSTGVQGARGHSARA